MIIKSKLLSNTKKFISPPHFASKEKTRIARLLNTISLSLMFLLIIWLISNLLQVPIQIIRIFNLTVMFSIALITFIMTRLEYVKQASVFISFALLVLITGIIALTAGGISSPVTAAYIFVVLISGIVLGKRGGLIFGALCLLALFGIYIMDISSYLPQSVVVHTTTSLWILKSLIFIFATLILNLALGSINRAREALSKSEKRLNEAQKIAQIGSWELDLTTNTIICSDEVYNIFNLESQQVGATYETLLDIIHPDDRELVNNAYTESIKNKTPYDITNRLLLKDGTIKFVQERCKTYYNDSGKAVRSLGTVQDITKLNKAQMALGERIKELRFLYEITEIAGRPGITLDKIYRESVNRISLGWQYPEITGGCITIDGKTYKTKNFKKTKWMQKENVQVKDKIIGTVKVCYLKEKPDEYEGPFLKEERKLIKNFAKQLGEYITIKEAEEELKKYRQHLEELVKEGTADLKDKNKELEDKNKKLEQYNRLFENREFRIKELRDKVKELEEKNN